MKKILALLFSTRLMAVLFLVFAAAMGIATFIENDFGTPTAKALVYNSWWFELIMVLFAVNFFGNIFRYRLYRKEKWSVLLFHLSFFLILLGAGVTRYISYEGIMPIKEGETTNVFFSDQTYLKVTLDDNKDQRVLYDPVLLSAWGKNNYSFDTEFRGQEVSFELKDFIPNAATNFIESEVGEVFIHFVESSSGSRHDHYIKKGNIENIHGVLVGFEHKENALVNFEYENEELKMESMFEGTFLRMADQLTGKVEKDTLSEFKYLTLHNIAGMSFVVPKPPLTGSMEMSQGNKEEFPEDVLKLLVSTKNETKEIEVSGGQYASNAPVQFTLAGLNFRVALGAKEIKLPFQIKLNDFQLEKYPGSESPMSYASEITVIDPSETFEFRVFMNNILDYKGYKFFQSSYEITSEYEETRLSVNHDYWGTMITYIGYILLYIGLMLILVVKGTRFSSLRNSLRKLQAKKSLGCIVLFFALTAGYAQHFPRFTEKQIDSMLSTSTVDIIHAEEFSKLIIQDAGGRMKPIHTFASQLLRKVTNKNSYRGLDANQVFVSMVQDPRFWFNAPVIFIKKENTKLRDIIGVPHGEKYARLADFFGEKSNYKIAKYQEEAFKKRIKNKFDQSVIAVDKRVNLFYSALFGDLLRIFPIKDDVNNKWVSQNELENVSFSGIDSVFVKQILPVYIQTLQKSIVENDYSEAGEILEGIKKFQKKYGASVYPEESKIELEVFYNKNNIFKNLFWQYMLAGVFLFIVIIIDIFKTSKLSRVLIKIGIGLIFFLFAYHMVGLGVRWYISGHAPWSNGYESMIYISWAVMLFGLLLAKKSSLTIGATAFVSSMILMFAHWNWMDPEIANLVPVLDSYWVLIHVSIIVASYGPFTLSMILGMLTLLLMALTTLKNKNKLSPIVKELTIINEMSMTLGLVLLSIGNFLGGMWANESWGRYWGWDPKETWALISIMIYAFVLHTRLVPGLKSKYLFNALSVFAFASILMTYLGVNHLLSGLHSYAAGEAAQIPKEIWTWLAISIVLSVFAYFKFKKYYKKGK